MRTRNPPLFVLSYPTNSGPPDGVWGMNEECDSSWSPDVYQRAWTFATLAHSGQTYGGPEQDMQIDYINHVGSVAMEVIWALSSSRPCNAELAIQCALLHDVIEDTGVTDDELRQQFGEAVARGVRALSKDRKIADRTEQMRECLSRIRSQPTEIWMVKLADRITNLYHPPYYWDRNKIASYLQEARMIYEALKEGNEVLAARLRDKIQAYKRFL